MSLHNESQTSECSGLPLPEGATTSASEQSLDCASALSSCRTAAAQGDAVSQYRLGTMYANGQGVVQDYAQARSWIHKAADQGHPELVT